MLDETRRYSGLKGTEQDGPIEGFSISCGEFQGCSLNSRQLGTKRLIVRDALLSNCKFRGCQVRGVALDGITLISPDIDQTSFISGVAMRRVRLEGDVGDVFINGGRFGPNINLSTKQRNRELNLDNEKFYEDVDWALDIGNVQSGNVDIREVPAELIRIDPFTQAVATCSRLRSFDIDQANISSENIRLALWLTKQMKLASKTITLDVSSKEFESDKLCIHDLRESGVLEPVHYASTGA